jgi:holo-[acyl-carrier protein] synthase
MAIYGIGTDLIEIKRMAESIETHGERFIKRIAHPVELEFCPQNALAGRVVEYWASRFAAKEAFAKALGTGIGKHCELTWVGVSKADSGKPSLVLSEELQKYCTSVGIKHTHLSLSHTGTHASAFVVLES